MQIPNLMKIKCQIHVQESIVARCKFEDSQIQNSEIRTSQIMCDLQYILRLCQYGRGDVARGLILTNISYTIPISPNITCFVYL